MKTLSALAMAISLIFAAPAFANDEHHPDKAPAAKTAPAPAPAPAEVNVPATVKKMQGNVRKMQAQLDRIGKAKTDEARQKAVADHMRTMQENMHLARSMQDSMMDCESMHGSMMGKAPSAEGMPERMQKMEKRMEMMERMMPGRPSAADQPPAK